MENHWDTMGVFESDKFDYTSNLKSLIPPTRLIKKNV